MADNQSEVSTDLKDLVSSTLESIRAGLKDKQCGVIGQVEFEIAVVKSKEAKGGFKFLVADATGEYCKESVSKIKFNVIGNNTVHAKQMGIWLNK